MSYILERLERGNRYYLVQTPNGFGQVSYKLFSTKQKVKEFYHQKGEVFGIEKSRVVGPIAVDSLDDHDFVMDGTSLQQFLFSQNPTE